MKPALPFMKLARYCSGSICLSVLCCASSFAALPSPSPSPTPLPACNAPAGYSAIRDASDFNTIRQSPRGSFFLCNDIIFSGPFSPIPAFSGTIEGNNKSLVGIQISRSFARGSSEFFSTGIFNALGGATIRNLVIERAQVFTTNANYVGLLAGSSQYSILSNIGFRNSTLIARLDFPWEPSQITAIDYARAHGSLVGVSVGGDFSNINVNFDVTIEAPFRAGGVAGAVDASTNVRMARSTGQIRAQLFEVGGLIGRNEGRIERSYAAGVVSGQSVVGGIMGINFGPSIERSYSSAVVSGSSYVGGFVGVHIAGLIRNAYSNGSVVFGTGDGVSIGGFAGWLDATPNRGGEIINSYSTTVIKMLATPLFPGTIRAFVGSYFTASADETLPVAVKNSYYDQEMNPTFDSDLGIAKSSIELKTFPPINDTFSGWDLSTIWHTRNSFYPRLRP